MKVSFARLHGTIGLDKATHEHNPSGTHPVDRKDNRKGHQNNRRKHSATLRYLKQMRDDIPLLLVSPMKHRHKVSLRHLLRRRVHVQPQKRRQATLRPRQQ